MGAVRERDGQIRGRGMTRLYDRRAWRRQARAYLGAHPLCAMCEATGRTTMATVVDHVKPHKGDEALFFDETNWQSLCKPCHDGAKAEIGRTGHFRGCDERGRPLDPHHLWNREG